MHAFLATLLTLASFYPDTTAFVTLLGRDTIALESYRRTPNRLEGEIVLRVPVTVHFGYQVDLAPDGAVTRSVMELKPLGAAEPAYRKVTLDFRRDSVHVLVDSAGGGRSATYAVPPGALPFLTTGFDSSFGLYESFGLYDLVFSRPSFHLVDSTRMPVVGALTGRVSQKRLARRTATLVDTDFFGIAWTHLATDSSGRITGADGEATTEKIRARRVAGVDIGRAEKDFAARDRKGRGIGIASPPDSVRTTLGGAHLALDYSSPRRRGRMILGGVVPYGRVWRTGANAATTLFIEQPMTIGNTLLPAGGYSLWTLPTALGVDLIINRQTGQWGTDYDSSRDLARVSMRVTAAATPDENFTITIIGSGATGELRIRWDTFVWSVPLKVN